MASDPARRWVTSTGLIAEFHRGDVTCFLMSVTVLVSAFPSVSCLLSLYMSCVVSINFIKNFNQRVCSSIDQVNLQLII